MADIINNNSGYSTGAIDTATTLINNVNAHDAKHINGPASAIVQIETTLGVAPDLRGTKTDLVERIAVEHNPDGTHKTQIVSRGGTGVTSVQSGALLVGTGTNAMAVSGVGAANQVLVSGGTGTPQWVQGLLFHGPSSVGTGSTRSYETFVSASISPYSGIHFFDTFTLNAGHTLTLGAGGVRLILVAKTSITINGTINASQAGGTGGTGGVATQNGAVGGNGTDQKGGNGGDPNGGTYFGGLSGYISVNGINFYPGAQLTGSNLYYMLNPFGVMGASGGGGGGGDAGGTGGAGAAGGGSIVLIAPVIVLGSGAILNTSGGNGFNGSGPASGGGGGGGGGNIHIFCKSYTDNGATFTQNGGTGGSGNTGTNGANGYAGVKQILIYG